MRLYLTLFREYPMRSTLVLLCLVLSVFADGIGMSTLLPLLSLLTSSDPSSAAAQPSEFERRALEAIDWLGLSPTLGALLSLIVAAMLTKGCLNLLAKRQVGYSVAQVSTDLRLSLLRALTVTRWSYYTRQPIGRITAAFSSEADRGAKAYLYAATIVAQVMQTALMVGIAMAMSWRAALSAAVIGGVVTFSLNSLVRMTRRAGVKQTRLMRRVMSRLTDTLQALKPLRAMAREELIGPLLQKDTNSLNKSFRKIVLGKEALRAIQEPILISFLAIGLYVGVGIYGIPISEMMVLGLLFYRTLATLGKMQRDYQSMVEQEPAYWAIREMLEDAVSQSETTLGEKVPTLDHSITLRGVDLNYGDAKVLDDASIEIPAGQITGLVGSSGGGKTTVIDLIVGLLRPDAGEIYIDDMPLCDVHLRAWREQIGYAPQEMFLLNDSVYRNVTLGDESITPDQVTRALDRAGATDFVTAMPEGVQSSVGERGSLLSGGQRQRISIARALVHDPKLLLMDEATAALDPETERALWASLVKLRGEITILAISHQPALFAAADRIYRVQGGEAHQLAEGETPHTLALA